MTDFSRHLIKYIVKDGLAVPCDSVITWAEFMESGREPYHRCDHIAGLMLSTVFLGLDHRFGEGEPLLWETMLFDEDERHTSKMFPGLTFTPEIGAWRFTFMQEAHDFHTNKLSTLQTLLENSHA